MEDNSLKRALHNEAGESAPQKRKKPTEEEAGKIDYTVQRRSPSLTHDTLSPQTKNDTIHSDKVSFKRPFGSEKTSMSFPEKLMRILSFPEFSNVIRWNRDGTEFCIFPDDFAQAVLDPHFQGTKLQSFTRKLNRFGFKRILEDNQYPKGTFAYHHEYFQRGREDLLKLMQIDSDKKQRKISTPEPAIRSRDETLREESKEENLSTRLDSLTNQLSGIAPSSTFPSDVPDASRMNFIQTQEELNRMQLMMGSPNFIQQGLPFNQPRLPVHPYASIPDAGSSFNPLLQPPLLSSLNMQSYQAQLPMLDTAFARDLSGRRQQLAQAMGQLPAQQQQSQGQESIDPQLLRLLLLRRQQQQQQRDNVSPQP